MAIFDSEYNYYGFANTQPVIDSKDYVDTMLSLVYSATKNPGEEVTSNLLAAYVTGVPAMAHRYYKYAANGNYYFGLPESNLSYRKISDSSILSAIQTKLGVADARIEEVEYSSNAAFEAAVAYLEDSTWWDINSGPISVWPTVNGYQATIDPTKFNVIVGVADNGLLTGNIRILFDRDWGANPVPPIDEFGGWYTDGDFIWDNQTFIVNVDDAYVPEIVADPNFILVDKPTGIWVIYTRSSEGHTTNYSVFLSDAEIEQTGNNSTTEIATFYPIAIFYHDKNKYTTNTRWESSLKRLVKNLNIDADKVDEAFRKALHESNASDIYLVDFFILFGAPLSPLYPGTDFIIDRESSLGKYVFEFYTKLYSINTWNRVDYANWMTEKAAYEIEKVNWDQQLVDPDARQYISGPVAPRPPEQDFFVAEAGLTGFRYSLKWSFIEKYESYVSWDVARSQFTPPDLDENHFYSYVEGIELDEDGEKKYVTFVVINPEGAYVMNAPDGLKRVTDSDARCPICYEILRDLPYRDAEQVLQEGLCSVVFTVIQEEVQWYRSSFWTGVFTIITIVIVVFTLQVELLGMLAALGITGVAATLLVYILKFALSKLASLLATLAFNDPIITLIVGLAVGYGLYGSNIQTFLSGVWKDFQVLSTQALAAISDIADIGMRITKAKTDKDLLYSTSISTEIYEGQLNSRELHELEQERLGGINMLHSIRRTDNIDINMNPTDFIAAATETDPVKNLLDMNRTFIRPATELEYTYGLTPVSEYI